MTTGQRKRPPRPGEDAPHANQMLSACRQPIAYSSYPDDACVRADNSTQVQGGNQNGRRALNVRIELKNGHRQGNCLTPRIASHRAYPWVIPVTKADRLDQPNASARFNEEAATYAVRGSEAADLEAGVAAIRHVLKTLPARPGVYRIWTARDRRAGVVLKDPWCVTEASCRLP